MFGQELAVEQLKVPDAQARHQMSERHLRRIAHPAEHALAEEGRAKANAVKPADQLAVVPGLDRMGVAASVKLGISALDIGVDPRVGPVGRCFGA